MSYDARALENAYEAAYLESHPEVERAIGDGQSDDARSTDPDPIVADNHFKRSCDSRDTC